MTHVVVVAFLALSLNQSPANTGARSGGAKFPTRTSRPKPPPQENPPEEPPPPAEEEPEPRPGRPGHEAPSHGQIPQYREEPYLTVIRRNMSQVESCWASARAWNPTLQGEVVVEWDISETGDVEKAEVTGNTTGKPELASCVLQAVKAWRFRDPNVSYPRHVRHPFRFQTY